MKCADKPFVEIPVRPLSSPITEIDTDHYSMRHDMANGGYIPGSRMRAGTQTEKTVIVTRWVKLMTARGSNRNIYGELPWTAPAIESCLILANMTRSAKTVRMSHPYSRPEGAVR